MKKNNTAQIIGIFLITAAVLLFMFYRVSHQNRKEEKQEPKTELEKLMAYDFDRDYPKTVRDVMKLYCRYMKYMYKGEAKEAEIVALNKQLRKLYAPKLLEYNDEDAQLMALKTEIASYEQEKIAIVGYTMAEASQIVYEKKDGDEYAMIKVTLNMKAAGKSTSKPEVFLLIKDAAGRWKIYGYTEDKSGGETE